MKLKSPLSKQTAAVYALLVENGALAAHEIGKELNIFPQAVYRSVNTLVSLGCVNRLKDYPARFEARPPLEGVETFSLFQRELFLHTFLKPTGKKNGYANNQLAMSFIENRSVMFQKCLIDMQKTKHEMNLLLSGDAPPAEVMLEDKRAVERGVVVRMLVQKKDKYNKQVLESYKRIGMQVRVRKSVQARVVIMDQKIIYFMSYDPNDINKSIGMRFEYPPMGQLMNTLFMHYWHQAEKV